MWFADRLSAAACLIDRLNAVLGRAVAWGTVLIVLVQVAVVLMRYALGLGAAWLSETIIYAHAGLFLMAAAWTLQAGGHVRVDIFYAPAAPRTKAMIDLVGALVFLLPFAVALGLLALPYVERSWAVLERSREANGLPLVFLLKSLIPAFAASMALQGIAQAIRAGLALRSPVASTSAVRDATENSGRPP